MIMNIEKRKEGIGEIVGGRKNRKKKKKGEYKFKSAKQRRYMHWAGICK